MAKLEDLVVDEMDLNEDILYSTLSEYIKLGKDGSVIVQGKLSQLNSVQQIIVVLLALKALKHLGKRDEEAAGPSEISRISGIKKGTVLPGVRKLHKEGLLVNEKGRYYVPNYNLLKVKELILGE